jgi:hypothetical protein
VSENGRAIAILDVLPDDIVGGVAEPEMRHRAVSVVLNYRRAMRLFYLV